MKILHVIPSLAAATGGAAVVVTELSGWLDRAGHPSTIVTTDASAPASSRKMMGGVAVTDMPSGAESLDIRAFPLQHPYRLAWSSRLGDFLATESRMYDVVHIHSVNLYPQWAASYGARKQGVPYIVTPHGALDPWIRGKRRWRKQANDLLWQHRMLDDAAAIHLTSEDEKRLIEGLKIRAPQVVIPNAFNVARFARPPEHSSIRERWLNNYQGLLVLNHGRSSEKKGLDILIDAMKTVRAVVPAHLALVGADDEGVGERLRAQACEAGLAEHVTFLPHLTDDELVAAIASADVWALPSHTENFGLAVVEAMAAGRPVVTSPNVNIARDAAVAGALVMVPNTANAVAAALIELLESGRRRGEIGRRAVEYVGRFDWSVVGNRFVKLYQSVAGGV